MLSPEDGANEGTLEVDLKNGTKLSIYRDDRGRLRIYVDPAFGSEIEDEPRVEYDAGFR